MEDQPGEAGDRRQEGRHREQAQDARPGSAPRHRAQVAERPRERAELLQQRHQRGANQERGPGPGKPVPDRAALRRHVQPAHEPGAEHAPREHRTEQHAQGDAKSDQHPHPPEERAGADADSQGARLYAADLAGHGERARKKRGPAIAQPFHCRAQRAAPEERAGPPARLLASPVEHLDHLGGGDAGGKGKPLLVEQPVPQQRAEEDAEEREGNAPESNAPARHLSSEKRQRRHRSEKARGRGNRACRHGSGLRQVVLQPAQPTRCQREGEHRRGHVAAVRDARLQAHVEVRHAEERADQQPRCERARRQLRRGSGIGRHPQPTVACARSSSRNCLSRGRLAA